MKLRNFIRNLFSLLFLPLSTKVIAVFLMSYLFCGHMDLKQLAQKEFDFNIFIYMTISI